MTLAQRKQVIAGEKVDNSAAPIAAVKSVGDNIIGTGDHGDSLNSLVGTVINQPAGGDPGETPPADLIPSRSEEWNIHTGANATGVPGRMGLGIGLADSS